MTLAAGLGFRKNNWERNVATMGQKLTHVSLVPTYIKCVVMQCPESIGGMELNFYFQY